MGAVHICNLYSLNKGQDAIRRAFGITQDQTGNLPPLPGIFPDQMATPSTILPEIEHSYRR
ncbi:hypothetical protein J2X36_003219 [Methylobacterium sp. BE186]|nr:hypothetical protein [Methylobacterium sp. BE186]